MLEVNRKWLASVSPNLLESYKPQASILQKSEPRAPTVATMAHDPKMYCEDYISQRAYRKQYDIFKAAPNGPKEIRTLVIGCTDGGHLLGQHESDHLVILEPDHDSFNHSLQIFDWPALMDSYHTRGGTVFLHVGTITNAVRDRVVKHLQTIGAYNSANFFWLHDGTEAGLYAVNQYASFLQDTLHSLGFFDDERVGMAHTINHIQRGFRFLTKPVDPTHEFPVVVCGNGPSLMASLPEIRSNRDRIILVACASTLATMFREGIKPDVFIAQERPLCAAIYIARTTTPEFRKGIVCIGLNPVHPIHYELFDQCLFAFKGNDLGTYTGSQFFDDPRALAYCNPQAANAGAAIMVALGFKNIYLAGVDCAFADDGRSHVEGYHAQIKPEGLFPVRGNLRDEVMTNSDYAESIKAMELLISKHKVNFFNLSDGAFIRGSNAVKKIWPMGERPKFLKAFVKPTSQPEILDLKKHFFLHVHRFRKFVVTKPDAKDRSDAFNRLDAVQNYLRSMRQESPVAWFLIKGTVTTQMCFLSQFADSDMDAFREGWEVFVDLVMEMADDVERNLLEHDEWGEIEGMPADVNKN